MPNGPGPRLRPRTSCGIWPPSELTIDASDAIAPKDVTRRHSLSDGSRKNCAGRIAAERMHVLNPSANAPQARLIAPNPANPNAVATIIFAVVDTMLILR